MQRSVRAKCGGGWTTQLTAPRRGLGRCRLFSGPSVERGFLPIIDPPQRLQIEAAAPWEAALDAIPKFCVAGGLRRHVDALPPFPLAQVLPAADAANASSSSSSSSSSANTPELWRAYLLLSFLSHGYIWCDGPDPPAALPATLAVPWSRVAAALDMPPVLVYSTYNLLNWRRIDPSGPIALGNICCLHNFFGGVDEEWFRLVHVSIEAVAGPAVARLPDLQRAAREGDEEAMLGHLTALQEALATMQQLLGRMGEKCDPYVYYHRVRLPMSGWKGNPRLPGGLLYQGVSPEPLELYGETGAQSSVVAALDAALGIEHECGWLRDYLDTMRAHMPAPHRRFIAALEASNAAASAAGARTPRAAAAAGGAQLRGAYDAVLSELEAFRTQHRAFAAQYIANFSKKETGTGGSDFMPALGSYRRTTAAHRLAP